MRRREDRKIDLYFVASEGFSWDSMTREKKRKLKPNFYSDLIYRIFRDSMTLKKKRKLERRWISCPEHVKVVDSMTLEKKRRLKERNKSSRLQVSEVSFNDS